MGDSRETTSSTSQRTCHGGRASKSSQRRKKLKESPFWMLSTTSSTSQSDQPRSHSECLSLVYTRSRVLVMSSLDVSNKVHSSQTSTSSSHLPELSESASPSKCTTNPSQKLDLETTSESTSRDFQKRTCPRKGRIPPIHPRPNCQSSMPDDENPLEARKE